MRPRRDLRSTISPSLHLGHITPVPTVIGFVFLHSGKLEHAKNLPYRPNLYTIGL